VSNFSRVSVRQMDRMFKAAQADGEQPFATIKRYWADPTPFEAEAAVEQRALNARIDASIAKARAARGLS
jgi:hypothetical protein